MLSVLDTEKNVPNFQRQKWQDKSLTSSTIQRFELLYNYFSGIDKFTTFQSVIICTLD